jgi:hypothetical protein
MYTIDPILLESDYLCQICKNLIYFNIKSGEEYCSNPRCAFYPDFNLATDSKEVEKSLEKKEQSIKLSSKRLNYQFTLRYLYAKRHQLINDSHKTKSVNIEDILLIDDVLKYLKLHPTLGRAARPIDAEKFLDDYRNFFQIKTMLDDIKIGRIIIAENGAVLRLKYWDVVLDLYRAYGLVSSLDSLSDAFKYKEIDKQKIVPITPHRGMEFSRFFQQNFPHIISQKYKLQKFYTIGHNYKYRTKPIDLAALLGLFFSIDEGITEWSLNGIRQHYERTCDASNISHETTSFLDQYMNNKDLVPILVRIGDKVLFDKHTLLFYIFYLIGLVQSQNGSDIVNEAKQLAADVFEDECRKIIRDRGYQVYPKELKSPRYGYDLMGVSESKKKIIIGEAKYRDLPPSSISGETLLQQELYPETDEGLYGRILTHLNRVRYFEDNFPWFKEKLDIKGCLEDYEIIPIIVNKFKPIAKKYWKIILIDYDSLENVI